MNPTQARVRVFEERSRLETFGLNLWTRTCAQAISGRGMARVALSGGRTPGGFYAALAGRAPSASWPAIHIFQADERFVPPDDEQNNFRFLRRTLLDHVPIPQANIHPVNTLAPEPEEAARDYEAELARHFRLRAGQFPRFDLIVLGLGEDGHTASLFPETEALAETRRLARAVRLRRPLPDRVTLTLPVINNARRIVFLVMGPEKAAPLKQVVEGRKASLPAALVKPTRGELLFLVDEPAAASLSQRTLALKRR